MFVDGEKIPLLAEEKLLMHLIEYPQLQKDDVHPREMTQDGMSDCTGISRPYVTKGLRKLREAGLVDFMPLARVPGFDYRRRAYFLTKTGMDEALRLTRVFAGFMAVKPKDILEGGIGQTRFGGVISGSDPAVNGVRPPADFPQGESAADHRPDRPI
jgi:DNA-binding transcriptional ArsR family regulator